jgi:hypothetical protein
MQLRLHTLDTAFVDAVRSICIGNQPYSVHVRAKDISSLYERLSAMSGVHGSERRAMTFSYVT